ncbi:MAG: ATP-dependent RNA helicase [Firmicutes bacterium HGW-Firmicutes-1]|jgi:ATP-dependent RNA helicase DeaD|nr:MAG: ATP-dependent RNA helicase [Firmicutes bacterium HGW-Firmicutes-1]
MIFKEMNVQDEITRAVEDMGYTELTTIQLQTIPLILEGNDIIGQSQTGTGKTAAFVIPILHKVDMQIKKPQVLILCPTRELSVQVANEVRKLTKYLPGIRSVAVYGGEPINRQIMALRNGAQIIIGTPGRTMDHIRRKTIRVEGIHTVILDEADEMLKMGFREDIEIILSDINEDRQTILFSATMPKSILDITNKYQKDPKLIKVKSGVMTADTIEQEYSAVSGKHKTEALCRILDVNKPTRCIVFCNKKKTVDDVADALQLRGYTSEKIHGDLKQELRLSVLSKFNEGIVKILVATDVAARGLDIKEVDLIINFDVPDKEEYYVHRIGRSGRAGRKGRSITLVTKPENRLIQNIMQYTKKSISKNQIPTLDEVNESNIENFLETVMEIASGENLKKYVKILSQVDKEKYSLEEIAAALIKMNLELHDKTDLNDINVQFSDAARSTSSAYGNREGTSAPRSAGRKRGAKGMTRMFINIGRKDAVKPNHILGAIIAEFGISADKVGAIDILEKFSFVDIDEESATRVLKKVKSLKINNKKVNVELANS